MFFVIVGWVIFRADTASYALSYLGTMIGFSGVGLLDGVFTALLGQYWIIILAGIVLSVINKEKIVKVFSKGQNVYSVVYIVAYLLLFFVTICGVVKGGNDPFIYFNF